ncbi:MAG: ATP-binding protein [Deltaproteobacteria bacterium]|jgi:hypothetical protein|nr:ATP-binding protein [Deltaproteobacteria bacterium]
MSDNFPPLPVGVTNFEILRQKNFVYVDKTMYFPDLLNEGPFIFYARPRRFGKSLTLRAFDAFCSGRVDLFRGLAAEKFMCSPDFFVRPVIRLDFSIAAPGISTDMLLQNINFILKINAERHNVSLHGDNYAIAFHTLLRDVHKLYGKQVILLIDEYDTPVIDLLGKTAEFFDSKLISDRRTIMQDFFSVIKSAEDEIEMAFITGITKFNRMGVFSKLNNLIDISLSSKYSAFIGYTQKELEENFLPFITETADKLKISEDNLLKTIKDRYNGFSFDGRQLLYNPFSILSMFHDKVFENFWMESGSITLIRKFLMDKELTPDQFHGMTVSRSFARFPGEIDSTPPEGFLYQSGYLTLRDIGKENSFALEYPNLEVREAISKLFLLNINSNRRDIDAAAQELAGYLASADISGMVSVFSRLLAGICYIDHLDAFRNVVVGIFKKIIQPFTGRHLDASPLDEQFSKLAYKLERSRGESYYRSLLQSCLWMAGAKVTPEKSENLGILDLEAFFDNFTYVFELKISKNAKGADKAVREGMLQIHSRGCGLASKNPILVSIAIGKSERNVVGCLFQKDGQETTVNIEDRAAKEKPSPSGKKSNKLPPGNTEKQ